MSRQALVVIIILAVIVTLIGTFLTIGFFVAAAKPELNAGKNALGFLTIEGTITDSRETVRQLQWLAKNSEVKGILVRVESPGGGVTAANEIYSEIKRIKESGKPVVVSMGTVAASGGYYIATPADVIVANPGTLTGSIGVIMELPVIHSFLDKIGMKVEVIKSREAKDIGSPFREMTDADRRLLQGVVNDVYAQFLEVVSRERKIPPDSLEKIADGRILTGRQAKLLGLVDTLGTLEDARRILAERCGIKGEPKWVKPRAKLRYLWRELLEEIDQHLFGIRDYPRLLYRCF
jgi:protease-4|uniref:Signal peptide peptidase SppA n=1 Tax=candidate division WOR-3 bacterium TaxID=2052148 RepID=A0A7V3PT83_UNCW3